MQNIYIKPLTLSFLLIPILAINVHGAAIPISLGTAASFGVLAGSTVTSTGATVVSGNLGVWPGLAVTGFPPGIVTNGVIHAGDAVAMQAQSDLTAAYNFAAGQAVDINLTGQDLGGLTLTPGVYFFGSSAQLTGMLTLDALGDPNAVFLFQIGSTLTTASASSVVFTNGGQGNNVFWQVGSSATLGTTTAFEGNILALTSITLTTGANIGCGRAMAQNGAVTMDTNQVTFDSSGCASSELNSIPGDTSVPEPATAGLLGFGLLVVALGQRRSSSMRRRSTDSGIREREPNDRPNMSALVASRNRQAR